MAKDAEQIEWAEVDFLSTLVDIVCYELDEEPDERLALRKALIAMIAVHDECCDQLGAFHTHLLTQFSPLAGHFRDHLHPFVGHHRAARGRSQDGRARVLLSQDFARSIALSERKKG